MRTTADGSASVPARPAASSIRFREALRWGLLAAGVVALVWCAAFFFLWSLAGNPILALRSTGRFLVIAGVVALSTALCAWIVDRGSIRLVSWVGLGQFALISFGLILGSLVAGVLTEPSTVNKAVQLAGPTVDGGHFDLREHQGQIVLLEFWATWCGPCVAQVPELEALQQEFEGHEFQMVGVTLNQEREPVAKFLEAHSAVQWPQVAWFGESKGSAFDLPVIRELGIHAIPTFLLVDRQGRSLGKFWTVWQAKIAVAEALGRPVPITDRLRPTAAQGSLWLQSGIRWSNGWLLLLCAVGGVGLVGLTARAVKQVLTSPSR